jgi:hypothetical protein
MPPGKEVRRFGAWWRLGHLLFAVSLMFLTLTGMTLMYADSDLGAGGGRDASAGPKVAGLIHRGIAIVFSAMFSIHLVYIVVLSARNWRTFKIVRTRLADPEPAGPEGRDRDVQVVPRPRPAPGVRPLDLLGEVRLLGAVLGRGDRRRQRLHDVVPAHHGAPFLPGWVFNVATIAHGEEAFLAAVFLFTVHFFNNHFRPRQVPVRSGDVHGLDAARALRARARVQYRACFESGRAEEHLVDAPSRPYTIASHALGFFLIGLRPRAAGADRRKASLRGNGA